MSQPVPLRSIQILRALAASLVVFGHALHDSGYIAERTARPSFDMTYFNWGFGVDIFFVISGFIMIYTTAGEFGCSGAPSKFILRRFVRIAPLYWLTTGGIISVSLVAPVLLNVPIDSWHSVISSYLFIPDIRGNGEVRPLMADGWTLNYEMFFYSIFACCLMLPLRRGVVGLCGFFVAISILGVLVTLPGIALPFWTSSIILEFVFGILIGLALRSGWYLSARAALMLAALGIFLATAFGPLWGWDQTLPHLISAGLPAAMLVAAAAWGPNLQATSIVTGLVVVGDASYSLYLTHPFVIRPLRNIWIALDHGSLPLGAYVFSGVLVSIIAAVLNCRLIERPATGWVQRQVRRFEKPRIEGIAIPNPV